MADMQNQINMTYDQIQDRILIRATENGKEYRAWWTRRLALRMSHLFQTHNFPTENTASHLEPEQQQVLGQMEKQDAVQQADFDTPFQDQALSYPLGEEGILVERIDINSEGKLVRLNMLPGEGEGVTLTLPPGQRYSFEHMLQQVMVAAEWVSVQTAPEPEPAVTPVAH